jgi:hypothetical protein
MIAHSRVSLTAFTSDEPALDMIIDAQYRQDSLIAQSFRPRSGNNVLESGTSLVFVRRSTEPESGCLTSASS